MPLYEYECERCGHVFEAIQKFSDPPITVCPKCGGPVHKLQSAPAFHLKGSGWYITDYARKDQSSSGKTDKTDSSAKPAAEKKDSAGEKTDAAKTEKPAEKSPAADTPAAKKTDA